MLKKTISIAMVIQVSVFGALGASASENAGNEDVNWRAVNPENILYIETPSGRAIFELNEDFAPNHVERLKSLVRSKYYDGAPFYRVIDGFVAQFGHMDGDKETDVNLPTLTDEFSRPIQKGTPFIVAQEPAFLSDQTGYLNGFPVGRDFEKGIEFLLNCRGTANFSRDGANTAIAHLAVMTGQAPRHLDNNTTQFGRVIWGMEHMVTLNVAKASDGGVIPNDEDRSHVVTMRIAADLPEDEQTKLMVMRTDSDAFKTQLENWRYRDRESWFINETSHKVDVCYYPTPVKLAK